jgi:hypothetical protein
MKIYHFYAIKTLLCFAAFIAETLCSGGAESTPLLAVGLLSAAAGGLFLYADE